MEIFRRLGRSGGLILLLFWCGCQNPFASPPLVGIILWNQEIQSFEENLQGVLEGLREEGFQDGLNLSIRVVNVTGDRSRAAAAVHDLAARKAQILITLGTVPTLVALEITRESRLPVVYSGVPTSLEASLTGVGNQEEPHSTGVSLEVPVGEQLAYLQLTRPNLQTLGILYCTATPEAEGTGKIAALAARDMGLKVVTVTIPDDRRELLEKALADLLGQGIQALFLPSDSVLSAPRNVKLIVEKTIQGRVPVMVPFESSLSLGALLSYHADFAEVGRQAGRQAAHILRGKKPGALSPEGSRVKRLSLNVRMAQQLELPLSRHLLSRAHDLY